PDGRVRMLEEIAADEIVLITDADRHLAGHVEEESWVLQAAEAEGEGARPDCKGSFPLIGPKDRLDDRPPGVIEPKIDEIGVEDDPDCPRLGQFVAILLAKAGRRPAEPETARNQPRFGLAEELGCRGIGGQVEDLVRL